MESDAALHLLHPLITNIMSTHEEEDFVPGTIRLLDPNNLDVVQVGQDAVVLLPHPSSDINDPLNWGTWRKRLSLFCLLL